MTESTSGRMQLDTQRLSAALHQGAVVMSKPENAQRLRQGLLLACVVWAAIACAQLAWNLVPSAGANPEAASQPVLNPAVSGGGGAAAASVDVAQMQGWHLFGTAAVVPESEVAVIEEAPEASSRDGIEKGARKTRLDLKLRGVLASTEDGLGHAIIEHKAKQAVYMVEDTLPVGNKVSLAKVMPNQVVLDNNGTYELLPLYEKSKLDEQVSTQSAPPPPRRVAQGPAQNVDKRSDELATAAAAEYRNRLYQNPQSLAEVVRVAAVREDGQLRGYSVSPGKQNALFDQVGLKQGDVVTSVNGIPLDDPSNTMRLYQTMRTASEAVFELERAGQPISLSISLAEAAAQ